MWIAIGLGVMLFLIFSGIAILVWTLSLFPSRKSIFKEIQQTLEKHDG